MAIGGLWLLHVAAIATVRRLTIGPPLSGFCFAGLLNLGLLRTLANLRRRDERVWFAERFLGLCRAVALICALPLRSANVRRE